MRVILVRHGETEDNVKQILSGQRGVALTELGHEQARLLRERLKIESLSRIYSSDLTRARLTAEAIGNRLLSGEAGLQERYLEFLSIGKRSGLTRFESSMSTSCRLIRIARLSKLTRGTLRN